MQKYRTNSGIIKNSKYVIFIFLGVIFFQLTMLKYIWSMETFSRIYNILVLVISLFFALHVLMTKPFSTDIWRQYLIPGIFVFVGMSLNIVVNALSNVNLLAQLGLTLPWVLFLIVPFLKQKNMVNVFSLWKIFYYFMLLCVISGLIDYYLIYYLGHLPPIIETPYGFFYIGRFSILFPTSSGPHFRFYSCFAEPGSLSMLLLPFIAYAFLYKKYVGMVVLLIGFYFTYSLGGYIGLVIISFLIFSYKTKRKSPLLMLLSVIIIVGLTYGYLSSSLSEAYETKGNSATIRKESFSEGLIKLPSLIAKYPFGMPLAETTEGLEKNAEYTGSNFIPLTYFQLGGLFGLFGYFLIIIMSLKFSFKIFFSQKEHRIEYIVAAFTLITMVTFLFQRTTVWENSMFALLYAPLIIDSIKKEL